MIAKPESKGAYYHQLERKIALAIVAVAFVPYAATFALFYTSYNDSTHAQVIGALQNVVQTHKRNIDDFLADRLANLQGVANLLGVPELSGKEQLGQTLNSMRDAYGAFVDLGLINAQGRHVAYAGPYGLEQADYAQAPWFKAVMAKGTYISDVFKGYREVPHFVAAIKLRHQGRDYILRATIDSARFAGLVEQVRLGRTGEAFIVSREGLYQTQGRQQRQLLSPAGLELPQPFAGVRVSETQAPDGRDILVAMAWLKGGDWLLVCQQDAEDALEPLHDARRLVLAVSLAALALLVVTTLLLTRGLVGRMAHADQEKESLNAQILQAGKLASLGELAAGVAHEINNPLAIMVEEAGWMEDLMAGDEEIFSQSPHYQDYKRSLEQIEAHGRRCKDITVKLLGFARSTIAPLQPTQVNDVVRDVAGLVERPARHANVALSLDLDPGLPLIEASPPELQQVLLNLVNNAVDAMAPGGGQVVVRTRAQEPGVLLEVADNGPGIPEAVLARIFDPFFTTKPVGKGTGLGLSICYGIINKLGGSLEAHSAPQEGATFQVRLPLKAKPREQASA